MWGTNKPLSAPKSTHPKVMGEMMNRIMLQLKDSSLRVRNQQTAKHPQEHASQRYGRDDEQNYPSLKDSSPRVGNQQTAKHPQEHASQNYGRMMNKIILQLKNSSLRVRNQGVLDVFR